MMHIDRERLAWAGGVFAGEGSIYFVPSAGHSRKSNHGAYVAVNTSQTDRRLLDEFRDAVELGTVYGPYKYKRSTMFYWRARAFEDAQAVIAMLWPWLGAVKQEHAKNAFTAYRAWKSGEHERRSLAVHSQRRINGRYS